MSPLHFLGRQAVIDWREKGFSNAFVTLEVHGTDGFDARGSEAIYQGDELVGRATSGGFGARTGKSLALAMVRPDLAAAGTRLSIRILGDRYDATVIEESPYDPANERLRA